MKNLPLSFPLRVSAHVWKKEGGEGVFLKCIRQSGGISITILPHSSTTIHKSGEEADILAGNRSRLKILHNSALKRMSAF